MQLHQAEDMIAACGYITWLFLMAVFHATFQWQNGLMVTEKSGKLPPTIKLFICKIIFYTDDAVLYCVADSVQAFYMMKLIGV